MTYLKFYVAALCILVSTLLGSIASAHVSPQRDKHAASIQERINLAATQVSNDETNTNSEKPMRFAQWYNWGNWSNWPNWRNWVNW